MGHGVGGVDFLVDIVTVLGLVGGAPGGDTARRRFIGVDFC